jgi:NitT/TauT family transport system permease protein
MSSSVSEQRLVAAPAGPRWRLGLRAAAPPVVAIALLLVAWHAAVVIGDIRKYLLPSPLEVGAAMIGDWEMYLNQALPTLYAILIGYAIAIAVSVPIAVIMVYSDVLRRAVYPLIVLSQVVPKVTLAPLFLIWFGFGDLPKILVVFSICFFPLVIDSVVGLSSARPGSLMLVRSMGANRWQAFWKVRWPGALPSVFGGAKVAITLAVVGAVVAEFVGSNSGLGVVLTRARGLTDTVTVFAAIGWLSVMGLVLYALVALAERLLSPRSAAHGRREAMGRL